MPVICWKFSPILWLFISVDSWNTEEMEEFMMKILKRVTAALLAVLLLPAGTCFAAPTDWGLGFGAEGAQPKGNVSAEELLKNDAYFIGKDDEKTVYLTFDAGFENGYMETILDTLKEKGVPAAFFVVGTYIRDNPELIRRIAAEGHIVGNHTMHHPDMSAISAMDVFTKELQETSDLYLEAVGTEMPRYYRPPQGKFSEENLAMAKELGYKTVFWSLAYVDWNRESQPTRDQAFSKLMPRLHPGAVLLLHSTSQTNAEIMGELIDAYRGEGYTFKSLDDLTC